MGQERKSKFLKKVVVEGLNECWIWKGARAVRMNALGENVGYGHVRVEKRLRLAHRVSFELFKGEIPEGMHVLHRCDTPLCVNPRHLFLGTHEDNMKDMVIKNRHLMNRRRGEKHSQSKVTEQQVLEIRASNEKLKVLAERYGVTFGLIGHIKARRAWKHI